MKVSIPIRQIHCVAFIVFFVISIGIPPGGQGRGPRRIHVVQSGESIARIADFYGVSQRDLRELNTLSPPATLFPGQKLRIPNVLRVSGKKYRVEKGDTLASIALKHDCDVEALANANKIRTTYTLQVGRTLVIPDKKISPKTLDVAKVDPVSIMFLRVATGERERLRLYSGQGEMAYPSVQRLSYLARDKRGAQKVKRLHFRLVKMLQKVGDRFPGKSIEIISGYRPQSDGVESQHAFGRAMDFRIPGVPAREVFRFCKTLPRSGCGFYPRDGFVHMDARERKTSWSSTQNN